MRKRKKAKYLVMLLPFLLLAVALGTVTDATNRVVYNCNGSTTAFAFTFPIIDTSDMVVILRTVATGAETVLDETTHYSLSATNNDYASGGTVTTVSTYSSAYTLTLIRNVPESQDANLEDSGILRLESLEDALDKLALIVQDLEEENARAIKFPRSDSVALVTELANSITRANQYLSFGPTGAATISSSGFASDDYTVSTYMETLLDDTSEAAARGTLDSSGVLNKLALSNYTAEPNFLDLRTRSPWHDVRAYGADTGNADNATYIQAAFDALSNGDTIFFPNTGSDYVVKSALTCDADSIRIIGGTKELGSRIDFQSMAGADGLTLGGYGLYLENISFWSSDSSTDDGVVLLLDTASNSLDHTLIHCVFSGHGGDGLVIARPVTTVLIGCKATGNGGDGLSFDGSLNGGGGGTSVTVIGCWTDSNTRYGCHVKAITGFNWTGGANVGNGNYAFFFTYTDGISVTGMDGEGAVNGFASTDSYSEGISFNGILVAGVGAGKRGFNIAASKAVTIDNVLFSSITGDHFGLTNVVDCHIGKVHDLDDGDASGITFAVRTGSCTRSPGQILSFDDSDATPSVCAGPNFDIPNAVTITRFDYGTPGQEIVLISKAAAVFDTTANARLVGSSVDITTATGDTTMWICEVGGTTSSVWRLMGFVDSSEDNSGGA